MNGPGFLNASGLVWAGLIWCGAAMALSLVSDRRPAWRRVITAIATAAGAIGVWTARDDLAAMDERIWQAVIGGGFIAAGWVYNGRRNRRNEARLRAERLRDVHRALFAEIATNVTNLWNENHLDDHAQHLIARMRGDPDFVPLVPRESAHRLYASIITEIHILPRVTIDPIVRFYSLMDSVAALAEDMRGYAFRNLSQERRIDMYSDYVDLRKQTLQMGRAANHLISVFSDKGKEAARIERDRIFGAGTVSSPVVDPSAT